MGVNEMVCIQDNRKAMNELIKLRDWVDQQCKTGQPFTCADVLNKIDEILESDDDIQQLLVTSAYEME